MEVETMKQRTVDSCSSDDDEVVLLELKPTSKLCSSDEENDTEITIETAFERAGRFGKFQKRVLCLLIFYNMAAAFNILAIEFSGLSPEWTCSEEMINPSHPVNGSTNDDCELYNSIPITNCTPVYTDRFYSIAQEWDLICGNAFKINLTQSGFFLGFLIGSYVLGSIGDWLGRRIVTIGFLLGLIVVQTLIAMSFNYYLFAIGRFIIGFLVPGGIIWFVLTCELLPPYLRSFISVSIAIMFGLSFGIMSLFAYVLPNWRWFTASIAVLSALVCIPSIKYVPESPRWLLVKGKELEAKQILSRISRVNGCSLPAGFALKVPPKLSTSVKSYATVALFKTRKLRNRMLLMMLEWFTVCMVYYGLSLGVGSLSSNIYLAFTLSGLVEIPSNLLTLLVLEKVGRKWTNVGFLLIAGVSSLCCAFVQFTKMDSTGYFQLSLNLLGKFAVAGSFSVIYAYTPELVPTDLRSSGMGVVNVCARLGGILAPLIILMDSQTAGLSMLIMGSIGTVTSILCIYLPETLNTVLPNTVADIK